MKNTDPIYTLSVASGLSGVPMHSIRQYIVRGMIIPYTKQSKRHLFSRTDILRLKFIQKKLTGDGLNIAGVKAVMSHIPCWAIRKCKLSERNSCEAYLNDAGPCWEASGKAPGCMNTDCRECEVYRTLESGGNVKSLLHKFIV